MGNEKNGLSDVANKIVADGADLLDGKGNKVPQAYYWDFEEDDEPSLGERVSHFFACLTYFVASYAKNFFTSIWENLTVNFLERPASSIIGVITFVGTVIWMLGFACCFGIANFFNLGGYLDKIADKYYRGNSFVNWGQPDILHDHEKDFFNGLNEILHGNPRNPVKNPHPNVESFSVPAAKTALLFATVAYESWENFRKFVDSVNAKTTSDLYISQARQLHIKGVVSFTRIVFVRDNANNQNLIFVVFRGTSPFAVAEWLTDASMNKVPGERYLWGACHEGFYTKLFLPLNENNSSVYRTILECIKEMIQKDVEIDGNFHPYYLASTGHSLGASYCHFFHSRLLKAPTDLDFSLSVHGSPSFVPKINFIGSYSYGGPRGGNFTHYSHFTSASRNPIDRHVNLWRVVDANDLIPSVVPGVDDPAKAAITATNHPQDILDFTHVGRLVHIHRFVKEAVAPLPYRVGTWKGLARWAVGDYETTVDYIRDVFLSWLHAFDVKDPVNIQGALFPFMGDHCPSRYYVNLDNAVEPTPTTSHEEIGA